MNNTFKSQSNKSVGKNIRAVRHQHNWSQEEVANKLGISIPAFSKIETGITDVNLSRLQQIADIFELSLVHLLSFEEIQDEYQSVHLHEAKKKLMECEIEIVELQRKVIGLYEELRFKNQAAVLA
jgi:transcriptional regulator with XRE-family HTH domain